MECNQVSDKVLSERLSKKLANFELSDEVIAKLANHLLIDGLEINNIDVGFPYGVIADYFTSEIPKLNDILTRADISRFEIFPYGIIIRDRFHIRVTYTPDELEGLRRVGR